MNKDKIICIREDTDERLIQLQSEGYRIIQISASGIYCWIGNQITIYNETDRPNIKWDEPTCQ